MLGSLNMPTCLSLAFLFIFTKCICGKLIYSAENMVPQYNDVYGQYDDNLNEIRDEILEDENAYYTRPMEMPKVQPTKKDTYLCYSYDFTDSELDQYIVGFEPHASQNIVHHILLYGCDEPGYPPNHVWGCGEMAGDGSNQYDRGSTCASGSQVVYAWARDAPKLDLPKGVGFKIGRNSDIKYIVLQVHYANVDKFLDGGHDSSGITLKMTQIPMPKLAGIYLLGTGGIVPTGISHLESACRLNQRNLVMHPFGYRTHTHSHGKVVSGYVIKNGVWYEIGKHDPLKPQMFYEVKNKSLVLENGDVLAARCTMQNNGTIVNIGSTHKDEMCNFYIMYQTDTLSKYSTCFSRGYPNFSWKNIGLRNIPKEASTLSSDE